MLKYLLIFTLFLSGISFSHVEDSIQDAHESIALAHSDLSLKSWRKKNIFGKFYWLPAITDYNMIPAHLRNYSEPGFCNDMAYQNDPNIKCEDNYHMSLSQWTALFYYMSDYNQQTIKQNEINAYNKSYALNSGQSYTKGTSPNYSNNSNKTYRVSNQNYTSPKGTNTRRPNTTDQKHGNPNRGVVITRPTQHTMQK